MKLFSIFLLALEPLLTWSQEDHDPYDISWATHSTKLTYNQELYDRFMEECKSAANPPEICVGSEQDRIHRNNVQPKGMYNYTETGFKLIKSPPELLAKMKAYWTEHREQHQEAEWQVVLHSYQNVWDSPTTMIPLAKYDDELRQEIWDTAEEILQEWSGQRLAPAACYGIRVYHRDAILATHVDFPPRIISAIINVDQDVDESWPLEIWSHDGKVYNITMESGDMVLYESHSIIHGRPYPFNGNYFANIFVHFEPLGPLNKPLEDYLKEPLGDFPPYLRRDDEDAMDIWKRQYPNGWQLYFNDIEKAAALGDYKTMEDLVIQKPELIKKKNKNNMLPIDLAIFGEKKDIVELLIRMGGYDNATELVTRTKNMIGEQHEIYKSIADSFREEL